MSEKSQNSVTVYDLTKNLLFELKIAMQILDGRIKPGDTIAPLVKEGKIQLGSKK